MDETILLIPSAIGLADSAESETFGEGSRFPILSRPSLEKEPVKRYFLC